MLDKTASNPQSFELQSLVDTHERPFVIIDKDFHIVAVNHAYEQAYGTNRARMIGRACYQVSHGNDRPCSEFGEECPHEHIYSGGEPSCSCLHIHHDDLGRLHRVHIKAYPLRDADGRVFLGEAIEELSEPAERSKDQVVRMVGESPVFQRTLEQLKLAALSDAPVLLEGETGVGKDLAANFIHQRSSRCDKPFMTLDCTVLTESLFEAEVFGHERGAFTGSVGEKEGLFEIANGGTLFLDEIGEMSATLQAKLLRVLETGEFRRVGGRKTLHTNARIICATNRNLGEDVEAKQFREDLYYRVACLHIQVPSLRERLPDIPLLTEVLLQRIGDSMGKEFELMGDAIEELQAYHYPGNVRELRNILSTAVAHCKAGPIDRDRISSVIECLKARRPGGSQNRDQPPQPASPPAAIHPADTGAKLEDIESQHIGWLLKLHNGNRRKVANALGISERTVYRKLKRYGLE